MFWKPRCWTDSAPEITASIKALKTLTVVAGRVSIEPAEVIGQPSYLEERARMGAMVRARTEGHISELSWQAIDDTTIEALAQSFATSLKQSREVGANFDQAFLALRRLFDREDRS